MNGASFMFLFLYLHIGKALYYGSYLKKAVYASGMLMFVLTMAIAFLGYVLPWGQMSY
jgi:ubiquinol-cytochrome c reductase cytochrome b subunit